MCIRDSLIGDLALVGLPKAQILVYKGSHSLNALLASLAGCGLSYIHIEVDGKEIPLLDGSAIQWVRAFEEVGIRRVPKPKNFIKEINQSMIFYKDSSVIALTPSNKITIISTINFPYKAIGNQTFVIDLNPKSFVEMIAPARTFGFKDQFQKFDFQ